MFRMFAQFVLEKSIACQHREEGTKPLKEAVQLYSKGSSRCTVGLHIDCSFLSRHSITATHVPHHTCQGLSQLSAVGHSVTDKAE